MNFVRAVEPLVWALIFISWVGIGPFAGVLALWVHSVAALTKLYSEQIESIDPGPMDAITATGASTLQVLRYGVVPQVIPPFLSFTIYRWDINVRMSTIIGFVGGGGIGYILKPRVDLGEWGEVGTLVLLIAATVWVMDISQREDPRTDRLIRNPSVKFGGVFSWERLPTDFTLGFQIYWRFRSEHRMGKGARKRKWRG